MDDEGVDVDEWWSDDGGESGVDAAAAAAADEDEDEVVVVGCGVSSSISWSFCIFISISFSSHHAFHSLVNALRFFMVDDDPDDDDAELSGDGNGM